MLQGKVLTFFHVLSFTSYFFHVLRISNNIFICIFYILKKNSAYKFFVQRRKRKKEERNHNRNLVKCIISFPSYFLKKIHHSILCTLRTYALVGAVMLLVDYRSVVLQGMKKKNGTFYIKHDITFKITK